MLTRTRAVLLFLLAASGAAPAFAQSTASATVVVTAEFASRTALHVSTDDLRFEVPRDGGVSTVVVDFDARARTFAIGEVVLVVEPLRGLDGPGGAADVEAAVTFSGEGDGTLAGTLQPAAATVAGRWRGSGRRSGRLVFTLHTGTPGSYRIPVRFVLTAP